MRITNKFNQWASAPKSERLQLEESLRDQHWTSPHDLLLFNPRPNKFMASVFGSVPSLNQFLRKNSWTKRWLIRIPIIVVYLPALYVFALLMGIFLIILYLVKLVPIYIRFRRITSKELRNFDQRIQDEKSAIDKAKKQEEIDQRLRTEEINRKKEYDLALSLAI